MQPRWNLLSKGCGVEHTNVFFAGSGFTYDLIYDVGVRKRLLSWHANTEDDITQYVESQKVGRESFGIVDSGAFTVWNKGGNIDVFEYGKKLCSLLNYFDVAANLDVIPGKKGMAARDITPEITEDAANRGWQNYLILSKILKENDHDPMRIMPIYHQGESIDWLKKMIDHGCEYIGVSPSNDYATRQRSFWLDDVFDYLLTLPKLIKTHGYAVTSPVLMKGYPWFSVDSASWVQQGGYGGVNTPFGVLTLSDRDSVMGRAESMDGRNWSPEMKKKVEKYFENIGLNLEGLKKSFQERWKANAIFMLELEKKMTWKRKPKSSCLFEDPPSIVKNQIVEKDKQDCFGINLNGDKPIGDGPMSLA